MILNWQTQIKLIVVLGVLGVVLAGCARPDTNSQVSPPAGMGNGMRSGMMERHHAQIPAAYAGLSNPIPADQGSFERGAAIYTVQCASCHGDGGMGDGPAGAALDPAPAAIAHTSQMMGDDYLFWRISDGSGAFSTAMPAWKDILDESSRWDLINYIRALGKGEIDPHASMGGVKFDPTVQSAQQAEILAQAVAQKVITQAEAEIFVSVHQAIEQYRADHPEIMTSGDNATERQALILAALVKGQVIQQAHADRFTEIHDRLGASGLMP